MTQPALDRFKKRSLLLKIQPVVGTPVVPVGATDAFRLFDGSSSIDGQKVERNEDRPYLGAYAFTIGNLTTKIEGDFELYSPATPGAATLSDADCQVLLRIAGFAAVKDNTLHTTRYNPVSSAFEIATGYWQHVDILTPATDATADVSALAMKIGERFKGHGSITGNYVDAANNATPTITLPTKVPVVTTGKNSTCILGTLVTGGTATTSGTPVSALHCNAKSLQVDLGNQNAHKEYTELVTNGITDRQSKFTMVINRTDITNDFDPFYLRKQATIITVAMSTYELDSKTGCLFSTLGIRGQIETVEATETDGDYTWTISGPCVPSAAGNDELYVLFGTAP